MNYVFEGETVDYYVLVRDVDGTSDIDSVQLVVDGSAVGACAKAPSTCINSSTTITAFGAGSMNTSTDQVYICKLIVPSWLNGEKEVKVQVTDKRGSAGCNPVIIPGVEADLTFFNPELKLTLTGSGVVNFGTVTPGSIATSNSIYLKNGGSNSSNAGVVMDMYIASDDYFTDPSNGAAICPTGNGIKYDRFSYYATKGSLNSGANNNTWNGLGKNNTTFCKANLDEFTNLTSHSGNIGDMCRVINWIKGGSLLTEGSEMSITFRLNVPNPCSGNFNKGKFHFAGKVV
jgi:hypothetical protein